MDKLKYIKLENEDGSYSNSIPLAVDSDHVDVNGNTLTNELATKASAGTVNTLSNEIQVQKTRIDNLASLEEGSTTGDAELIDIRTGYNGFDYINAGDAVREGDTSVYNTILNIADESFELMNYAHVDCFSGQLWNNDINGLQYVNGGNVKKFNITNNNAIYYATMSLNAQSHLYPAVIYFNSENQKIGIEYNQTEDALTLDRALLHIPKDAAWFYLNTRNADSKIEVYDTQALNRKIDFLADILRGETINLSWNYGKNVYVNNNNGLSFVTVDTRSYLLLNDYATTEYNINIIPNEGFENTFIEVDSNGYAVLIQDFTSGTQSYKLKDNYTYYIAARKKDNTAFSGDENILSISYSKYALDDDFQALKNSIAELGEISPDDIYEGKLYSTYTNSRVDVGNGIVFKVNIQEKQPYYITTSLTAQDRTFPLILYFNEQDECISFQYPNSRNVLDSITDQLILIPNNAKYFYINARSTTPIVKSYKVKESEDTKSKKELSILFVGNSLTQDGIAYLPYLLKNYYGDEINFKIYMWYCGGFNLSQHYERFINDQNCDIFSIANNKAEWTNGTAKMSSILSTYQFDVVCMQEYFNYKESFDVEDLVDWNNCQNYIREHYTGGNMLKFVSLFHAPKRSSAESIYNMTKTGNSVILKNTISEDVVPIGMAVYRALSTDLDNLGDQGHLSPDGTHTQEGLPCLLQTYVALLWVLDQLSINKSIYNCDLRMTTDIYNTIHVPGPNLGSGVITGTDAQNILAQEVAIKAFKEGKKFVIDNLSNY